ncbi:ABC-type multidrug transport system, permease component [Halalkaliarchaeum sp. AArc-CO]|uniref:ABC transporter permease n=1 Tax=unclassified Halalkaliarchaeum TaxID=2678344 RepID=UPI00217E153D|nr:MULTISPECIES: ABC transporter permease [unclassified Halalkaliarchaeum]MDR5671670.1 ABC transporter permease [Halalkaliarchaeum sp. AArc-GB]UWG51170.1 ABC-type multidrug transport system, permease component [Halalkaliarchaeum sp. AArc-CO]
MIRDTLVFLWTEAYGARRNIAVLLVGFVLLPGLLVGGTVGFDQTLPEDVPIGVAPGDEATTDDDLTLAQGGVALLGTPEPYDTREKAIRGLDREEVYIVVLVPPDVLDQETTAEFRMLSHGSAVPLIDATGLLALFLDAELSSLLSGPVEVTHEQRGVENTLSEYLIPTGITLFVLSVALLYVPYDVRVDRQVLDRIRHQSRLEAFLAAKLLFYTAMMAVVLGAIATANLWLEYRIDVATVETMAAVGLLFLSTAAIGTGVLFLTGLGRVALFVNLGVLVGIAGLGSLVYPVGFFSPVRMEIARSLPPHYLAVIIRGHVLRGDPFGVYLDWYRFLGLYTLACLGFCWVCVRSYEWRA